MKGDRSDDPRVDAALEREIERALAVHPSPDFTSRIRAHIAKAPSLSVSIIRAGASKNEWLVHRPVPDSISAAMRKGGPASRSSLACFAPDSIRLRSPGPRKPARPPRLIFSTVLPVSYAAARPAVCPRRFVIS